MASSPTRRAARSKRRCVRYFSETSVMAGDGIHRVRAGGIGHPRPMNRAFFGLRAQIIVALFVVLTLAATLAMVAVRPLTVATGRIARRRLGLTLARSVAGEVALTPDPGGVHAL